MALYKVRIIIFFVLYTQSIFAFAYIREDGLNNADQCDSCRLNGFGSNGCSTMYVGRTVLVVSIVRFYFYFVSFEYFYTILYGDFTVFMLVVCTVYCLCFSKRFVLSFTLFLCSMCERCL